MDTEYINNRGKLYILSVPNTKRGKMENQIQNQEKTTNNNYPQIKCPECGQEYTLATDTVYGCFYCHFEIYSEIEFFTENLPNTQVYISEVQHKYYDKLLPFSKMLQHILHLTEDRLHWIKTTPSEVYILVEFPAKYELYSIFPDPDKAQILLTTIILRKI